MSYGITADTGGHIAYVLEAALAQGSTGDNQVTIVTRLFDDDALGLSHACATEILGPRVEIHRLATGNRRYLEKDALADDRAAFIRVFLAHLGTAANLPHVIHAHFADAAAVAMAARRAFGIPFVYTPHALALDKRDAVGESDALSSRVAAERDAIARADAVIVSSEDEAERQIGAYGIAGVVRRMHVIAPGIPTRRAATTSDHAPINAFEDPQKPLILAVARPVRKKNMIALVEAFSGSELWKVANLAILSGQHAHMASGEAHDVIRELRQALNIPRLKESVHFPPKHTSADVAAIYCQAAALGGVFVNPALHEPFGLTLLEAAAANLPVVATRNGGAADIVKAIGHGCLVDPRDPSAIATACLSIVTDPVFHADLARAALRNRDHFSWSAYASRSHDVYTGIVAATLGRRTGRPGLVVCDIDGTLTGCRSAAAHFARWAEQRSVVFIVATGRSIEGAQAVLKEWGLPLPDAFITEVGTRLYTHDAAGTLRECADFTASLDLDWDHVATSSICMEAGLEVQASDCWNAHKLSFFGDAADAEGLRRCLARAGLAATVVHSHDRLIDVLSPQAGKAAAVEAYARVRGLDLDDCVAAGDSGNDRDMLERCGRAIVVGNALPELLTLQPRPGLIRVNSLYAAGVLEGLTLLGIAPVEAPVLRPLDETVPA